MQDQDGRSGLEQGTRKGDGFTSSSIMGEKTNVMGEKTNVIIIFSDPIFHSSMAACTLAGVTVLAEKC